jgi:hypothetical protein
MRRQLLDLQDVLRSKKGNKALIAAANKLDSTVMLTEGKLVQFKYTGTGQDDVRYPDMLAGKIGYLAGAVASADFRPADQHIEVYNLLKSKLTEVQAEWNNLLKGPVADFLKLLEDNKVKPIVLKR